MSFYTRWKAKRDYINAHEINAVHADLQAGLAELRARDRRASAKALNDQADAIDKRDKEFEEMENKGYWLCDNGHEYEGIPPVTQEELKVCFECVESGIPADQRNMRFIKRSEMTGQEKYESDKERKETQKMAADHRARAQEEIKEAEGSELTAKNFRSQAANFRATAEKLRRL